ncbi:uncharacterized protein LOC109835015 [Asparagus officinalis]|uniref:uncharacterized protein LOC109835015 n=1 Tax=Asparagus officinalis TaxID=4686 RepID=UPI00098E385E|nr:uncharacterized protein LOC109835015 [Asparagus officinalis]
MVDGSLLCVVTKAKSNKGSDDVFVVIKENTEITSLKYQVSQRLKIPTQSLSLKFICEREKKFSISIDNDEDLCFMFEYCRRNGFTDANFTIPTENSRCAANTPTQTCNDERIPNDNSTGDSIMLLEDMINNQTKIPAEWHTAIREIEQKFDSAAEVRLALQYYSIAKRFDYNFYHNEQRRIRVYCRFKHTYGCPWMLFASPLRNSSIMSIKNFYPTHTYGQHGANAGNSRASRKFITGQIQAVLNVRPDLRAVDIKNDMLSNYGIKINYSKAWYEDMVHATNPGSRVVIDDDEGRFRCLFICYNENEANWKCFLQGLWTLPYDREKPYNPPHQLVMISDADKGIKVAVEEFFSDALHSRCDMHLVENFKKKMKDFGHKEDAMKDLASIDHRAYVTAMEYSSERWENTHFSSIRYDHVTSNVDKSFNNWIRNARLLRILPLVEMIRKQIMECMYERRVKGHNWSGNLCPEAELVLKTNIEHGSCLAIKQLTEDVVEVESNKTCRVDLKKSVVARKLKKSLLDKLIGGSHLYTPTTDGT